MSRFLSLPLEDQRIALEQAAASKNITSIAIEKDFWVCWTLGQLFSLEGLQTHLTFKGGTSLSKVFGLIQRLSEDIDLVIDKKWLGFDESADGVATMSGNKKQDWVDQVVQTCSAQVCGPIRDDLHKAFASALTGRSWSLEVDENDKDRQTLLFKYPQLLEAGAGYLSPWVKIELGARGDIDPDKTGVVQAEVAKIFPQLFEAEPELQIRALDPVRTFLEKAALLHEENYSHEDRERPPKMARHYYDLSEMIHAGIGNEALASGDLFSRVVEHRRLYYKKRKEIHETLARGTLRLVPISSRLTQWAKDYEAMQTEMFYGSAPDWSEVLGRVEGWEKAFNTPE